MLTPSPALLAGPIRIDGYEQDAALSKSELLTRTEVLMRRSRRLKQLVRMYKKIYWDWLLDGELRSKVREYYWEYGSPFIAEEKNEAVDDETLGINGGNRIRNSCGMHGCKAKAMALTRFCHMHILHDEYQTLYKECNFAIKSSAIGPIICGKPVLRSIVPTYCPVHLQMSEKHMVRALKNSGLNTASTSKLAPKLHVLVSEYVRQILQKRRCEKRANMENAEVKKENNF